MDFGADEVEVIGDFGRFGIPLFLCGRAAAVFEGRSDCREARLESGRGRNAEAEEGTRPVGGGGDFRRLQITVNCHGRCLSRREPCGSEPGCCCQGAEIKWLHLISLFLFRFCSKYRKGRIVLPPESHRVWLGLDQDPVAC